MAMADASGRVPIVAAVLGVSAGHGALGAPLADYSLMTADSVIFAAGPPLVRAALGEDVTKDELGGADVALASGLIHDVADDEGTALDQIRSWLSYLPSSAWNVPPARAAGSAPDRDVLEIVPVNPRRAYDMVELIEALVDHRSWFEVQQRFGRSMVTGLARIAGRSVAIVANQPDHMAGTIDVEAADKAAHFVGVADRFHVPLLFLTDNPGVLAGSTSERAGILRHAGRLFAVQHSATVPKVQVTIRKAFGFGSTVMAMNPFDNQTLNLAWPGVTLGAMPARGAGDAVGADESERAVMAQAELDSTYRSAANLSVDDVIDPRETRRLLVEAFALAAARSQSVEPKGPTAILR
jgi:acetyl-CoA carboxylase carboxyltransferase component